MKKLIVLFVLLSLNLSFPQEVFRKQITFIDGADCKNFTAVEPFNHNKYFAFEADYGIKTNIFLGHYDTQSDTFIVDVNVTDNNFQNTNPSLQLTSLGELLIVYQTNENGNWDIAYKNYFGNDSVSATNFLTTDPADEYNPKLPKYLDAFFTPTVYYVSYQVNYLSGIGISVKPFLSTEPATSLFFPYGDNYYNDFSFAYLNNKYVVAATVDSSDFNHYIVYRTMQNNVWGDKRALLKAEVFNLSFDGGLSFNAIDSTNGKSNIFWIDIDDSTNITKLFDEAPYDVAEIHVGDSHYITDRFPYMPVHCFKAGRNDSLFISVAKTAVFNINLGDSLIYTKVKTTSLGLGRFDWSSTGEGEVFYSVWQDSVNNHVQLFGRKSYYPLDLVQDNVSPESFTLGQNYPNPFNPSTTINYSLGRSAHVKISIYSLLGELIAIPVNDYQSAGDHKVLFNASNLSSGVYFYELSSDGARSVKKMTFIK